MQVQHVAERAQLDGCLKPWHVALKELGDPMMEELLPCSDHPADPYVVWINASYYLYMTTHSEPLDRACEAVALLTLLARVDLSAWKEEMMIIYPRDEFREWIQHAVMPATPHQRFAVGIHVGDVQLEDVQELKCLSSANERLAKSASAEFHALRTELEGLSSSRGELVLVADKSYLESAVRIHLDFTELRDPRQATPMLQEILAIIKTLHASRRMPHTDAPHFVVVEVCSHTDCTVDVPIRKQALDLMQQIAACGVRLGHLPPLDFPKATRSWNRVVGSIRSLLCVQDQVQEQDQEQEQEQEPGPAESTGATLHGLHTVVLAGRCDADLVPSLLTAVQESPVVQTMEIDLNDPDGDAAEPIRYHAAWEHVAYSLFSHHARHKIQRLLLNLINLTPSEIDAVRHILTARNPLVRLDYGRRDHQEEEEEETTNDGQDDERRIVAAQFCLNEPEDGKCNKGVIYKTPHPLAVRVISAPKGQQGRGKEEQHEWYSVVLPGHGKAWVHPDDLIQDTTSTSRSSVSTTRTLPVFPRIDIDLLSDASSPAAVDLLAMIGHGTTHITYQQHYGHDSVDNWCRGVLASCPALQVLHLDHAGVHHLDLFVECALAGQSRLRELHVGIIRGHNAAEHVRVFVDTLCDPHHPLTTHLQSLSLCLCIYDQDTVHDTIITPLLAVLGKNRRLTNLHLEFTMSGPLTLLKPTLQAAFDSHEEDEVFVRCASLPIRSKLAFLSVLSHQCGWTESCERLDSSVLAIIFQFAAESRERTFTVRYHTIGGLLPRVGGIEIIRRVDG